MTNIRLLGISDVAINPLVLISCRYTSRIKRTLMNYDTCFNPCQLQSAVHRRQTLFPINDVKYGCKEVDRCARGPVIQAANSVDECPS